MCVFDVPWVRIPPPPLDQQQRLSQTGFLPVRWHCDVLADSQPRRADQPAIAADQSVMTDALVTPAKTTAGTLIQKWRFRK